MSRIFLYSDFKPGISDAVDRFLVDQLHRTSCRIGYIPSASDLKRRYFGKIKDQYLKLGISDLVYFDLGQEYDASAVPLLLSCDAIHLSGGDPVEFLDLVKKRNFQTHLKSYLKDGGILIGVSAGAMLLSKSLDLADDHWLENSKRSTKRQRPGLGLFDFEFYPHFKGGDATKKALLEYEQRLRTKVYACDDDAGIFLNQGEIHLLGPVYQT